MTDPTPTPEVQQLSLADMIVSLDLTVSDIAAIMSALRYTRDYELFDRVAVQYADHVKAVLGGKK